MLRHHASDIERLYHNNCRLLGVFDTDEGEIGQRVGNFKVEHVDRITEVIAGAEVSAAVIAVTSPRAQQIAETLVNLGAKAILNLSGQLINLPYNVRVSSLDVAGELLELCYYC
jgi:NADH/NAD ratio-sensing transcriptional regulator Rex